MLSLFLSQTPEPTDSFWYGRAGSSTAAGISVTSDVAMTYSAVWACTRVLSASGSCLPLNLMRRSGNMTAVASDHHVQRLLHFEPNAEMGSMGMRSIGIIQQVNEGNFYAEIQRDPRDFPAALWPLNPHRVKGVRANKDLAAKLGIPERGLAWRIQRDNGTFDYLADRDIFHVRSIISDDGIIGKGVIQNARETIAHGIATVQQGAAYMKNSARPSVVIKGGKFKNAEDREEYRRMWMDVHGGAANNAKPAMLPQDAELTILSFSPEDSQFIQTMQHSIEEICRWYGVPPHMAQHLLRSTFSNIEHQGIDFVVYSLIPWLKLWEEEAWRKLLSPLEQQTYYVHHNVNGLLRGDSAARAAFYQSLWQLGAFSINEIRSLEDMNPIEGGDGHFVQTSYTTIDKLSLGEWNKARDKDDVTRDEYRDVVLKLPPAANDDDATLLSLVGGLTGSMDISKAVASGEMTPESANELLQLFLRIDSERAKKIAGDKVIAPPEPTNPVRPAFEKPDEPKDDETPNLSAIKALLEYNKPPDALTDKRIAAVQDAARLMVEETASRMLSKEIQALDRAASKEPTAFFGWCDEFYQDHEVKLAEALRRPLQAYATAMGECGDMTETARQVASEQIRSAKEVVLSATECQPEEWSQLGQRLAVVSTGWRESRVAAVVTMIQERVKQ